MPVRPSVTEAGTVGAIVRKGKKLFLLSNSHVLAGAGIAALKDTVLYPGPGDGGKLTNNIVGALARFVKFKVGALYFDPRVGYFGRLYPNWAKHLIIILLK